ncbi:MAG: dephospho-CoA kinase, partial [Peptostreptococcaceae bacterium]|nr:dephospho-CoA kinase [Peptostreptococcaceae bacterium]
KNIIVIDAALLIEAGYLEIVDKVLVITCNENIQIKRIQKRDNCSKEEALSRISSQISQEDKVKYADYVLDNSGDLEELKEKTKEFLLYMKENWRG